MPLEYRFYTAKDAEKTNQLAHAAFPIAPFPADVWQKMEDRDHLTVVADDAGWIVGAIPFDLRDFLIRPGVSLRAAFAHMVCVDEAFRGKGVGSALMHFAKQNLPQFCEGMFVYTGSEGVQPYTFYEKNGFIDLHYSHWWEMEHPSAEIPSGIQVGSFLPEIIGEETLNDCFQRAYRCNGGFPIHAPGFWRKTMDGILYAEIPTEFAFVSKRRGDALAGYAILGISIDGCTILELAADPAETNLTADLLTGCAAEASRRNLTSIQTLSSTHHPAISELPRAGFHGNPRADAMVTAGMVFNYPALWQRLTAGHPPFGLNIWTPTRSFVLEGPGETIHLEMKDSVLNRLFLCREDVRAAWEAETITSPAASIPLDEMAAIFQPARWVFHWFEWI